MSWLIEKQYVRMVQVYRRVKGVFKSEKEFLQQNHLHWKAILQLDPLDIVFVQQQQLGFSRTVLVEVWFSIQNRTLHHFTEALLLHKQRMQAKPNIYQKLNFLHLIYIVALSCFWPHILLIFSIYSLQKAIRCSKGICTPL